MPVLTVRSSCCQTFFSVMHELSIRVQVILTVFRRTRECWEFRSSAGNVLNLLISVWIQKILPLKLLLSSFILSTGERRKKDLFKVLWLCGIDRILLCVFVYLFVFSFPVTLFPPVLNHYFLPFSFCFGIIFLISFSLLLYSLFPSFCGSFILSLLLSFHNSSLRSLYRSSIPSLLLSILYSLIPSLLSSSFVSLFLPFCHSFITSSFPSSLIPFYLISSRRSSFPSIINPSVFHSFFLYSFLFTILHYIPFSVLLFLLFFFHSFILLFLLSFHHSSSPSSFLSVILQLLLPFLHSVIPF